MEARKLIGWVKSLDGAYRLGWDQYCVFQLRRSHLAAQRTDAAALRELKPPAAELLKFWRANFKEPRPTQG